MKTVNTKPGNEKRPARPKIRRHLVTGVAQTLLAFALFAISERIVCATTYTWFGGNGDWNVNADWSPSGVPGIGDTAVLGSGTYTLTVNSVQAVGALDMTGNSGTQTLALSSGMLTINNASAGSGNAVLEIDGGTLAGPGDLALAGPLEWNGGTITNIGVSFMGGALSGYYGTLFLAGAMLTNNGVLYWTNNASIYDGDGSVFTNPPGSTIIISNNSDVYLTEYYSLYSSSHVFGNGGIINIEGSGTEMMYEENFVNSGTININGLIVNGQITDGATLYLYQGTFVDSGSVITATDLATLQLGGVDTFTPASSLSGPGSLIVSGGTVNLNSGLAELTGSWTFSGGDTTITGPIDDELENSITISGNGLVSFEGSGLLFPSSLTINGGTLAGPQTMSAANLNWNGGTITNTGILFYGGGFSGYYGTLFLVGAALTNSGTLFWTNNASMYDGGGSVFTNLATGTIVISNSSPVYLTEYYSLYSNSHVFGNAGTIILEGSGAATMYEENFVNSGTIDIDSSTLTLNQGTCLDSGPVTVAPTATLELAGADTFTPASSVGGQDGAGGNLLVSGGTVALNGSIDELSGSWTFSGGTATVTGPDSVLLGALTVSGGAVSFDSSGPLLVVNMTNDYGTLEGPQDFIAGQLNWNGGTITNTGILFSGGGFSGYYGSLFLAGAALTNSGVLFWTNNASMYDGDGSLFTNLPGATIVVSNNNAVTFLEYYSLYSNSHVFGNAGTIILEGSGTETMYEENFVNSGTIDIDSGTLSFNQGGILLANGTLNFGISDLNNYGSITFNSFAADLGGTLTATVLNPSFVPAAGDQWPIITYGSVAGNFSNISLPPIGDWEEMANPADYVIEITQTAPAPFFEQNLAQTNYALAGAQAVMSVEVGGTPPFTNRWFYEAGGVTNAVQNGGRFSGATTTTLTIVNAQTNDDGPYQLFVTNGFPPYFDISGVSQLVVEEEPLFNGNGALWTLNGGAAIRNNVLTLTDGQQDEARSAFYYVPMYCQAFRTFFTYQSAQGTTSSRADGITFCLQNTVAGTSAVGVGGGSLGYKGITNSLAIAVDQFTASGIEWLTNGADPASPAHYTVTAPAVVPGSGNPINVSILYEANTLFLSMTDTVTLGTFTTNFTLTLPPITDTNQAFVGFTGGDGDLDSVQTISNFTFVPIPPIFVTNKAPNVVLSWPTGIGGYQLQGTTNIITGPWITLPGPYSAVGTQYQFTVSPTGNKFYRLMVIPY